MTDQSPPESAPALRRDPLVLVAAALMVMLAAWVIWKFGGFDLMTTITVDGRTQSVANTFATVDHPFHAARAESLLQSLQSWQPLRWIGSHQGGYPVEFYPLGIAGFDVGLWALFLGTFPIIAVHKLTVLLVFVSPGIGFWILARGDRLNPFVPVLALAIQVAMPGLWTTGGMIELIAWGLVANVGGASLAFIAFAALCRYVSDGNRPLGVVAIVTSSAALYANTRSGIAIAVAAIAILLAAGIGLLYDRDADARVTLRTAVQRVALAGGLSVLLTAPLLLAMLRYADYYYFVNYNEYVDIQQFWNYSLAAVSTPLVWVAIAGVGLAFAVRELRMLRMVALAALLYVGLTVVLFSGEVSQGFIQQLETPRLMPFQRLLVIYLAAATIGYLLDLALRWGLPRYREAVVASVLVVGGVWAVASFDGEYGTIPEEHLTSPTPTTGTLEFAEFSAIVAEANEIRPEGTAIYVVGDQESWWHEQLWATAFSDAPFFYDDWMWYWQPELAEACNPNAGHFTPNPARTFEQDWLRANGIGVLLVTNMPDTCGGPDPRHAAEVNPLLEFQATIGYWDLYLVKDPSPMVTNGDVYPESVAFENGEITATFASASGRVEVRHNWYPRWQAYADGERVEIREDANGYILVDVPDGTRTIELRYAVTALDWLGRIAAMVGIVLTALFAFDRSGGRWSVPVNRFRADQ
jgi:hypothetical protein